MSLLPKTKWGVCSLCGGREQEVVKVKKDLFCLKCRNEQKTDELISKQKKRLAARNTGNKLRKENILGGQYADDFIVAERQALINDLDFVFSRIVRMSAADKYGYAECYTCDIRKHWSLLQCGHYEKRGNTQIRWYIKNAKPQCKECNESKHGNYAVFTERLDHDEKGLPELLKEMAREPYKWSREELKQLLIDLRQKLKLIETKFNTIHQ